MFSYMFIGLLCTCTKVSFGESLLFNFEGHIKFASSNNCTCQARPTIININSNEILFYSFTVKW